MSQLPTLRAPNHLPITTCPSAAADGGGGGGGGGCWNMPPPRPEAATWPRALRASSVLRNAAAAASWPRPTRAAGVRRSAAVGEGGGGGGGVVEERDMTFYELLGISEEGSFEEIRAAYRRMARKYHPDVSPPEAAEEHTRRFIEVQEAYETLSDPGRRARYDRALARGLCGLASMAASRRGLDEEQDERFGWRTSWQDQLAELKKRSMRKESDDNLSWGARMRRRRAESSTE